MRTCQPWCTGHVGYYDIEAADDVDICIDTIPVTFGWRSEGLLLANSAAVDLSEAPDGQCIMLHLNGIPAADLDPRQAAAIGAALLAQSAQALGDSASADYYRGMAVVNADTAARSTR